MPLAAAAGVADAPAATSGALAARLPHSRASRRYGRQQSKQAMMAAPGEPGG